MWQHASLEQLVALETLIEEGSLVRAASRLHTTHSTLSRGISRLCRGLGMELFDKTPRGLKPNAAGKVYASEIRKALGHAQRAYGLARWEVEKGRLPFRVGHCPYIHGELLRLLIDISLPGTNAPAVALHSAPTMQIVRWVLNGELEAGFGVMPIEDPDLRVEVIAQESFSVCMQNGHNLSRYAKVSAPQLHGETLFWIPRRLHRPFYDRIVQYLRTLKIDSNQLREAQSISQELDFAALGAGISLVPQSASRFNRPGVQFRPLTDQLARIETALFFRRGPMTEALKDFVAATLARAQKMNLYRIH
jgi:LysR family transcriptional regulator, benzoate and cis,cis-muconate-responsive activator of ben and cat genes